MMPKIEFRDKKTLKLANVLSRKVPEKELFSQNKQIHMLDNWLRAKGYQTVGPLVMYSSGVKGVNADSAPIIDSRIMIQLTTDKVRLELPYRFEKEIRIENCLLARFDDNIEKIQFATMKLQVYAYENDLEPTGETYMVIIDQQENKALIDVFMPVKITIENE